MVAAITMIIAIGQFAFTVGGISFNGIAIGTIVILVAYHGLKGHWQGNRHYCQRRSGYFVV